MKRLHYFFDKLMMRGIASQLFLLFLFLALCITLSTGVIVLLAKENPTLSLWQNFMLILDPGNLSGISGALPVIITATLITFLGIFVWSALVAILNDSLHTKLNQLRMGTAEILEHDHSIILGWSGEALPLVSEYIDGGVKKIVILCEENYTEISRQISFLKQRGVEIFVRQGSPTNVEVLSLLNISQCRSIAVLSGEDPSIIKAVLAIKKVKGKGRLSLTAIIHEEESRELLASLEEDLFKIYPILKSEILCKLIAQSSVFRGLTEVYEDLFSYKGNEFYLVPCEETRYGDCFARFLSQHIYPVGVEYCGAVSMAPSPEMKLMPQSRLIVLAESTPGVKIIPGYTVPDNNIHRAAPHKRCILIISITGYLSKVEREIRNYISDSKTILSYSFEDILSQEHKNDFLKSLLTDNKVTQIVLISPDTDEAYDTVTMNILIRLRHIVRRENLNIPILTELHSVQNRDLVAEDKPTDFIVSGKMAGMFMAQASLAPELLAVFNELLDKEGKEIIILPLDHLKINAPLGCKEAYLLLAEKEISLMGIQRGGKVYLRPQPSTEIKDGDLLVVVIESETY